MSSSRASVAADTPSRVSPFHAQLPLESNERIAAPIVGIFRLAKRVTRAGRAQRQFHLRRHRRRAVGVVRRRAADAVRLREKMTPDFGARERGNRGGHRRGRIRRVLAAAAAASNVVVVLRGERGHVGRSGDQTIRSTSSRGARLTSTATHATTHGAFGGLGVVVAIAGGGLLESEQRIGRGIAMRVEDGGGKRKSRRGGRRMHRKRRRRGRRGSVATLFLILQFDVFVVVDVDSTPRRGRRRGATTLSTTVASHS